MTGRAAGAAASPGTPRQPGAGRQLLRDQPLIPLSVLLVLLIVVLEIAKPGIVNGGWLATTLQSSVPKASRRNCFHVRET